MVEEKTHIFTIDVKTDGINGKCFWIAAFVIKKDQWEDRTEFNGLLNCDEYIWTDAFSRDRVYSYANTCSTFTDKRKPTLFASHYELIDAFWTFYLKYHECSDIVTDSPLLSISNLFSDCLNLNQYPDSRKYKLPYPLLDISSMLHAKRFYSNISREAFMLQNNCSQVPRHWLQLSLDPLCSSLVTFSIFIFLTNLKK